MLSPMSETRVAPLDDLDRSLLAELDTQPRAGVLLLARRLGVARNTVTARLERLQSRGVISLVPTVDPVALGYEVAAFVTVEVTQVVGQRVGDELGAIPEVLEAYMTIGNGDVMCRVVARDNDHLGHVVQRILAIEGVLRTTTALVLATHVAPRTRQLI